MSLPILLLVAGGSLLQGCGTATEVSEAKTTPPPPPAPVTPETHGWSRMSTSGPDGELVFEIFANDGKPVQARCTKGGRTTSLSLPTSWLVEGTVEHTTANVDDDPDPELISVIPVMTGMGPQGAIPTRTPVVVDCTDTGIQRLEAVEDAIGIDPDEAAVDAVVRK